jgi:hypothetical protein
MICVYLRYLRLIAMNCDGWAAFVSLCLRVCDVGGRHKRFGEIGYHVEAGPSGHFHDTEAHHEQSP